MDRLKETIKQFYRVDRREISFIKYIFEGWDNMAVLTTLDRFAGTVMLSIAPGAESDVAAVLARLENGILIEAISPPEEGARKVGY
ncbi:MAG: DUF4911 domain-containing protein [Thermodesulfobacteriota bacterium]|nr:DUF4911 domain-containing protein [Thermodesulfobacteriota bacterium]